MQHDKIQKGQNTIQTKCKEMKYKCDKIKSNKEQIIPNTRTLKYKLDKNKVSKYIQKQIQILLS